MALVACFCVHGLSSILQRYVDKNYHPDDNHYRNLLAIKLWAVARHEVVRTDSSVLGLVLEDSYDC